MFWNLKIRLGNCSAKDLNMYEISVVLLQVNWCKHIVPKKSYALCVHALLYFEVIISCKALDTTEHFHHDYIFKKSVTRSPSTFLMWIYFELLRMI